MIRQLAIWGWRGLASDRHSVSGRLHLCAIKQFPTETVFVNKLTGTFMQIVGGLVVLHSVDTNLGLFRNHSLAVAVIAWFRECPIFTRTVTISATGVTSCSASSSATVFVTRAATTIDERLAEVERRIEELRSEVAAQNRAIHTREAAQHR